MGRVSQKFTLMPIKALSTIAAVLVISFLVLKPRVDVSSKNWYTARTSAGDLCATNQQKIQDIYHDTSISVLRSPGIERVNLFNSRFPCQTWIENDAVSYHSGLVQIKEKTLPILSYTKGWRSSTSPKMIFLNVVGGPAATITPSKEFHKVIKNVMNEGDIFVTIGYTGTAYGILHPKASFSTSCVQVRNYIDQVKKLNPTSRLNVISSSLGGLIVSCAEAGMPVGLVHRYIYLSPMMNSPEDVIRNFESEMKSTGASDSRISVNVQEGNEENFLEGKIEQVPSAALFHNYFNDAQKKTVIWEFLNTYNHQNRLLIFGINDEIIGTEPKNAALYFGTIARVNGMGHHVDEQNVNIISNAIRSFVK